MNNETNLGLILKNGKVKTDSRKVAEVYEKEHRNVIKKIEAILAVVPEVQLNFEQIFYNDVYGREQPMYEMDRQGFSILVNKFTGDKALKFTYMYTKAFEEMTEHINNQPQIGQDPSLQSIMNQQHALFSQQMEMMEKRIAQLEEFKKPPLSKVVSFMSMKFDKPSVILVKKHLDGGTANIIYNDIYSRQYIENLVDDYHFKGEVTVTTDNLRTFEPRGRFSLVNL